MKTPKYYTPSIDELHVGFEYECLSISGQVSDNGDWNTFNFGTGNDMYEFAIDDWAESLNYYLEQNKIRVKFLNQEDIEELGFEHVGSLWFKAKNSDHAIRKRKGLEIDVYTDYSYRDIPGHGIQCVFRGQIKNKSELKKVLQMVGVIKE